MLIVLATGASSAWAGSVSTADPRGLIYTASPGENNNITVHLVHGTTYDPVTFMSTPGEVDFIDDTPGAQMTPNNVCTVAPTAIPTLQCSFYALFWANANGGDGNDNLNVVVDPGFPMASYVSVALDGGPGDDTIVGGDEPGQLTGGPGADHVTGGDGSQMISTDGCGDVIDAGAGDDEITVGGGATVHGGSGDDHILPITTDCTSGSDIYGDAGNDTWGDTSQISTLSGWPTTVPAVLTLDDVANDGPLTSAPSNLHSDIETVTGGPEDDYIAGSNAAETLAGGDGNDVIDGGGGADVINGGNGEDVVDYSSRTTGVTADLDGQAGDDGAPGEGDTVGADVEDIWGGSGNDVLTGNASDNVLNGGLGADVLNGLAGEDVADYSDRVTSVNVTLDDNANDGAPSEGDNVASDIEDIWGGDGNDALTGSAADNVFDGGLGADTITGGAGMDIVDYSARTADITADLSGSAGNDGQAGEGDSIAADVEGLIGGSGNDILVGNTANGVLFGGDGNDYLSDPGGQDLILGEGGNDAVNARDNAVDSVSCGDGADQALADKADDLSAGDCEAITTSLPKPPAPVDTAIVAQPLQLTRQLVPAFTFTSTVTGATFRCSMDQVQFACQTPYFAHGLTDGRHSFAVWSVAPDGRADTTPAATSFTVDRTGPQIDAMQPKAKCVGGSGVRIRVLGTDANAVTRVTAKIGKKVVGDVAQPLLRLKLKASQIRRSGTRLTLTAFDTAGNNTHKTVHLKRCHK